jgi:hypothetical protein
MDGCAQFSQKGRICLKKWKWILLIALVVIILSFFIFISPVFSLSVKPSDVDPDFPIPSQSERVERSEADPSWTLYEIAPPLSGPQFNRYREEIEKWGWKEIEGEQMGRLHVFEKDGKRMLAVLYGDGVSLKPHKK